MQESCFDYSQLQRNCGCCLKCQDFRSGCLCFDCKCSKCYWYLSPDGSGYEKGYCEYKTKFWRKYYEQKAEKDKESYYKLKNEKDKKEEEKIKKSNEDITMKPEEVKDGRSIDELQEM
jgi:hypothetical protein